MDIRRLPAGQGLVWFKQAIDLGAKNPRAMFGAAMLLIATLYAAVLVMALVLSLLVGGEPREGQLPDMRMLMLVALAMTLLIIFLVPILLGGLMHVVREAESGRPVRARDLFAPLRNARGQGLAWLGLVQVVLAVVGGGLVVALAGTDYWRDYMKAVNVVLQGGTPVMTGPQHPGLLFVVQMLFNYFSYALLLFSIPLMLFSGCGLIEALKAALQAAIRNAAANLLAGVLFLGAVLVGGLVAVLVSGLMGLLGGLLHPAVGSLLAAVVMMGFAVMVLVLVAGAAYLAWRDTFGDGAAPAAQLAPHQFEA
ncbi:MAG: hypothetical protein JSS23_02790 [Proteobacteria bacterium]|nr:hypothetical protein [Pseudomonadota bacterium]